MHLKILKTSNIFQNFEQFSKRELSKLLKSFKTSRRLNPRRRPRAVTAGAPDAAPQTAPQLTNRSHQTFRLRALTTRALRRSGERAGAEEGGVRGESRADERRAFPWRAGDGRGDARGACSVARGGRPRRREGAFQRPRRRGRRRPPIRSERRVLSAKRRRCTTARRDDRGGEIASREAVAHEEWAPEPRARPAASTRRAAARAADACRCGRVSSPSQFVSSTVGRAPLCFSFVLTR